MTLRDTIEVTTFGVVLLAILAAMSFANQMLGG
jgi:hypothetical protein